MLCLVNPLTFEALKNGHPEEILTAALVVGAVAVAADGRSRRAALVLGLALATKQWAVLAILPTLMALPGRRVRAGLGAAAVALTLTLPFVIASPGDFKASQQNAASTSGVAGPFNVWYPAAAVRTSHVRAGDQTLTLKSHHVPSAVADLSHPLIVLLGP